MAIPDKMVRIEAINRGDLHVQIASFSVSFATGAVLARHQGLDYLLPAQRRQWLIKLDQPAPPAGTRLTISARTDAGELDAEAPLER